MLDRTRIGLLALLIFASLVACDASATPLPSNPPAPTTTAIDVAPAYRPDNPGPVSALERFLKAEVTGDFEASFEFLSPTDQEAADGVEGWVAQHYLVVPTIRGFQLISDNAEGVRAEVLTDLTLQAGLDQLVGLIPGEAQATWVLVDEAGEWRVAFSESRITPVFLDDSTTAAGVAEWAGQSCPRDSGLDLPLLGYPVLADRLCDSTGQVTVGGPSPLEDAAEAAPFLAAFGPEVGIWARVVEVHTPVALRAVAAPIGDRWVVIGVLEP